MTTLTLSDSPSAHLEEARRLAVLDGLDILDTPPEAEFDTIIACAQRLLGTKIALLSLVGEDRQWFKAKHGIGPRETPRPQSFCAHAIRGDGLFVVPDATRDARFADNPLVRGGPQIRFYAGVPIHAADPARPECAYAMGTVCVIDDHPRTLSPDEAALLADLGRLAESLLSARTAARRASSLAQERGATLQRLDITHRQFRQAERMADIGSWRLTLGDNRTEWSDQLYAIHGMAQDAAPELDEALSFYPPEARTRVTDALARTIESGDPFSIETDLVTAQGVVRRIRSMGELERRDGKAVAVIGVMQDITAWHRMEQQLQRQARRDDLTGLANRAYFNEVLDAALATARRDGSALALALIDLDHFKAVNDTQGHLVGDAVLRTMAARLGADYLAGTFAARLGGDEFVLLIPHDAGARDLDGLLARLSGDLQRLASFEDAALVVSATIGAAWLDETVDDRSDLLHRADLALYEAKRAGRGTIQLYRHRAARRAG
ncbi:diguanylate cyclase domain-containing protein [Sphingomonas sp. PAMC 26605]|uniref:diguanylate cyclase domain-containing protein n=1 Tax=Sphingomonas sp. PAMC 26605 TaxID=1112214 RepID=UPI0002D390A7|nr:diguanylate cyclase [Sphingomonas sp. PAMC 26605]